MISELLRKLFGLESPTCITCEVYREQLAHSERERHELLTRLLERDKPEQVSQTPVEEPVPMNPQFTPWRVRQQMLEAEDRKKAQLMREKAKEISELEKELGINASEKREAI